MSIINEMYVHLMDIAASRRHDEAGEPAACPAR